MHFHAWVCLQIGRSQLVDRIMAYYCRQWSCVYSTLAIFPEMTLFLFLPWKITRGPWSTQDFRPKKWLDSTGILAEAKAVHGSRRLGRFSVDVVGSALFNNINKLQAVTPTNLAARFSHSFVDEQPGSSTTEAILDAVL